MSINKRHIKNLKGAALKKWLRQQPPLYSDSIEFQGMSLSFVNPEIVDTPPAVQGKKRIVKAVKRKKKT